MCPPTIWPVQLARGKYFFNDPLHVALVALYKVQHASRPVGGGKCTKLYN